jgi:DNA mismatch endonuclease (patch repair protein)
MTGSTLTRDPLTSRQRSRLMAKIRPTGNRSTEGALAVAFRRAGVKGWRRHVRVRLNTTRSRTRPSHAEGAQARYTCPDFIFPRLRVAVYVDGCFWHGCPQHGTAPTQNSIFWREKLASNRARDSRVTASLRKAGWTVVRIWEHSVKTRPATCVRRVRRALAAS